MIISDGDVQLLRAPLLMPFRISLGAHDELENLFIRLYVGKSIVGYGEAAIATHITGETIPQTLACLKKVIPALKGRNIQDYLAIIQEFKPYFIDHHAGFAAFEMALLDAWCRGKKIPLWKLFGRRIKKFSTDITVVIGTVKEAKDFTQKFYRKGFRTFKIKIGKDEQEDFSRIEAVVQCALRSKIILDANQSYTAKQMLCFLNKLKEKGIVPCLLEQPVHRDDFDGLAKLNRESGVVVCADESAQNLEDVKKLIKKKAVSAVNIKLMKSGILEAKAIAEYARLKGIKLMMGAMMESALAITTAGHFVAGIGGVDFVDLDTTFFVQGPLGKSPAIDQKGCFDMSVIKKGILNGGQLPILS